LPDRELKREDFRGLRIGSSKSKGSLGEMMQSGRQGYKVVP
jgi:hypothetical protein